MRILLVANPAARGATAEARRGMRSRLAAAGGDVNELETVGDGEDEERIVAALSAAPFDVVAAAGGDGTHRAAASAILRRGGQIPDLVPVPLGTANNFARSLGFASAVESPDALGCALDAASAGSPLRVDVGRVDGDVFLGSFSVGVDGEILATRNRNRGRFGGALDGYPLYLAACAATLASHRGVAGEIRIDGEIEHRTVYNLLVTNVPIYAGEFRFDSREADGELALHLFDHPADYVPRYALAWPRHFLGPRGSWLPRASARRFRRLVVDCDAPVRAQADGEDLGAARRFEVRVEPAALAVRRPRTGGGGV